MKQVKPAIFIQREDELEVIVFYDDEDCVNHFNKLVAAKKFPNSEVDQANYMLYPEDISEWDGDGYRIWFDQYVTFTRVIPVDRFQDLI
jgi:hypothetical protein